MTLSLRERLSQPKPLYNIFQITPTPWVTEWMGKSDIESITLDLQHGMIGEADFLPLLQAMRAGGSYPFTRLAWNRPELIMKALDYGVAGLICPMIEHAEEAAAFVRAAKYPPMGNRSFGPFRASLYAEEDYFASANSDTLCFAMIETASALADLERVAATPGLDGLYVGPFDLSVSMGLARRADFRDSDLDAAIERVLTQAKQHNLFTGVFTVDPGDARHMAAKGFDLISCGTEDMVFQSGLRSWQKSW